VKRKTLAAVTSVVDQELGQFEAVVSAWDSDREQDTIAPTAFDKTIAAWRASGKMLPLLFEHSSEVIGHIDPFTMRATEAGLLAAGEVDRGTEHGQQVWKQIKRNTAGFSIGYLAESTPRKGGGRHLLQIDLLERSPRPPRRCTRPRVH
jgi:HK97 family phage prohead protease